jgi:hypothetical protein
MKDGLSLGTEPNSGATTEEAIARPAEASAKLDRGLAQLEEKEVNIANAQMAAEANVQDSRRATLKTAIMKDNSQVVRRAHTAGKNYHEDCKSEHPDENKQGPPSTHVGLAMMLSALYDEPNVPPELKVGLKEIVDFLETQDVEGAAHVIKYCRIPRWKPGMVKTIYRFVERDEIVDASTLVRTHFGSILATLCGSLAFCGWARARVGAAAIAAAAAPWFRRWFTGGTQVALVLGTWHTVLGFAR